jgi:hypothetical protein
MLKFQKRGQHRRVNIDWLDNPCVTEQNFADTCLLFLKRPLAADLSILIVDASDNDFQLYTEDPIQRDSELGSSST